MNNRKAKREALYTERLAISAALCKGLETGTVGIDSPEYDAARAALDTLNAAIAATYTKAEAAAETKATEDDARFEYRSIDWDA